LRFFAVNTLYLAEAGGGRGEFRSTGQIRPLHSMPHAGVFVC